MSEKGHLNIFPPDLMLDRRPENGVFELTVRCNLHCKMCLFKHDDSENADLIAREKTAAEWIDMARQVAEAGTINLTITGGEPLLRKDFPEIWEGLSKIGFILTLYTNATLMTPEVMDLFCRYPPHCIGFSLYGASEETYEKVTGNGNAYNHAIEGIYQLATLPSHLDFRTTIIKDNLPDIDRMEEWIKSNFGRDRVLTHTQMLVSPVRGACANVSECRLEPEENIQLYFRREIQQLKQIVGSESFDPSRVRISIGKKRPVKETLNRLSLFGCDAGMKGYTITWDGKLLGCQALGIAYTEPYVEGFENAWERYPMTVGSRPMDEKCLQCEDAPYCLSCSASRYAEMANQFGRFEWICENTQELLRIGHQEKEQENEKSVLNSHCPF